MLSQNSILFFKKKKKKTQKANFSKIFNRDGWVGRGRQKDVEFHECLKKVVPAQKPMLLGS